MIADHITCFDMIDNAVGQSYLAKLSPVMLM